MKDAASQPPGQGFSACKVFDPNRNQSISNEYGRKRRSNEDYTNHPIPTPDDTAFQFLKKTYPLALSGRYITKGDNECIYTQRPNQADKRRNEIVVALMGRRCEYDGRSCQQTADTDSDGRD